MLRHERRRNGDFVETLSIILVTGAFLGAFIVLLDVKLTLNWGGQTVQLGAGFAPETKGMVLQSMLITGFAAVVGFWLSTTKQGQDQAQSVSKIAEAAAPATASAVAAARSEPVPAASVVTPAPINLETGITPAVEVAAQPKEPT